MRAFLLHVSAGVLSILFFFGLVGIVIGERDAVVLAYLLLIGSSAALCMRLGGRLRRESSRISGERSP